MTDLLEFKPNIDDVVVTLQDGDKPMENKDGSPMTITLFSPNSKKYKAIMHEQQDARVLKVREKALESGDEGTPFLGAAELEEISLDILCKTTKEWNITLGGVKPKLTMKKAREVYEIPVVRMQVEEGISKALVFMKA